VLPTFTLSIKKWFARASGRREAKSHARPRIADCQHRLSLLFPVFSQCLAVLRVLVGQDRRGEQGRIDGPALPMARVATGMPAGICTIDSSESSPCNDFDSIGTPSTGSSVLAATTPPGEPLRRPPR